MSPPRPLRPSACRAMTLLEVLIAIGLMLGLLGALFGDSAVTIAASTAARASGFPRMARSGQKVYFAWTEAARPSQIRTAMATLNTKKAERK